MLINIILQQLFNSSSNHTGSKEFNQISLKMIFSASTHHNDRTTVCREVFRILAERAPPTGAYDVAFLKRQTYVLDDLLYKISSNMEEYCDLNTLEQRMLEATGMILQSPGVTAASVLAGFLEYP